MEYILKVNDVCKKYKGKYALNEFNMTIQKGDIYGFVGENGSGKTTIIRVITGLILPNSGDFELYGAKSNSLAINKARKKIGAIVESPSIYKNMSARANLKMQCDILGVANSEEKIKEALEIVGLIELYNDKKSAGNFSLGMRQRLGIAMVLLGDPEFIILDEPMNGLDPAGIVDIRNLILKLNQERGITFLISSHILTELSLVATRYGIISHGKMIREISNEQLKHICRRETTFEADNVEEAFNVLKELVEETDINVIANKVVVKGDYDVNVLLKPLIENSIVLKNVNCKDGNIEDYYLSLIEGGKKNA